MTRLLVFAFAMALGQILFKKASLSLNGESGMPMMISMVSNMYFIAGICLYAGATILWVVVLKDIKLVHAYPFVALGFVLVPIAAHFVFGEALGVRYALGSTLILAGIFLSTTS